MQHESPMGQALDDPPSLLVYLQASTTTSFCMHWHSVSAPIVHSNEYALPLEQLHLHAQSHGLASHSFDEHVGGWVSGQHNMSTPQV